MADAHGVFAAGCLTGQSSTDHGRWVGWDESPFQSVLGQPGEKAPCSRLQIAVHNLFSAKDLPDRKRKGKITLSLYGKVALSQGKDMAGWKFYGRKEQLADLERMLERKRWFFAKVTGRRRIGKTTLIQQAMRELGSEQPVLYVQIPDSEPAGVLSAINDALDTFQVPPERHPRPNDLLKLAKTLEAMAEAGYILILDEFQYFNRKGYEDFCSYMQASVDRLAAKADRVTGGLIVLGSIHTEMVALLEDRTAPLYNRVTDDISLTHLDIGSVLSILRDHSEPTPERLLFLWNLFEGVPKFYRDCYERPLRCMRGSLAISFRLMDDTASLTCSILSWILRHLLVLSSVASRMASRSMAKASSPWTPHFSMTSARVGTSGMLTVGAPQARFWSVRRPDSQLGIPKNRFS